MELKAALFLKLFFLFWILAPVTISSDEATVVLELIDWDDPRIACNESKKSCAEKWMELNRTDHFRYRKIVQRLRSGSLKDNGLRDIGEYRDRVCMGTLSQKPFLNSSGSFNLSCTGSSAKDMLVNDAITILTNGTMDKLQNLVLGVGIANGTFVDTEASLYRGEFSYCLVDHLSDKTCSSYSAFGDIDKFKTGLQSQIQHTKHVEFSPHYAAHEVNVSMRGKNFVVNDGIAVFDSGSTLPTLPYPVYDKVVSDLKEFLDSKYKEMGPIPPFEHCYNASGFDENTLPTIVVYFDGIRYEPPVKSYIIDVEPQVKCIGLRRGGDAHIFIIVSMMQENHIWEFGLFNRILGFVASICSLLFLCLF